MDFNRFNMDIEFSKHTSKKEKKEILLYYRNKKKVPKKFT